MFCQAEFHPGVPWKGLQNIDPENDPDVTPGSVPTGPTINTTIQDVNRYLLKSGGIISIIYPYCIFFVSLLTYVVFRLHDRLYSGSELPSYTAVCIFNW